MSSSNRYRNPPAWPCLFCRSSGWRLFAGCFVASDGGRQAKAMPDDTQLDLRQTVATLRCELDAVPQDVTRVLLNLFGYGFYAATKRSRSAGSRPVLKVPTRDLRAAVDVRVRDNVASI